MKTTGIFLTGRHLGDTDQVMNLLTHSFLEASKNTLQKDWDKCGFVCGFKNIAAQRPAVHAAFLGYAKSEEHQQYPLRQFMAAYVALESAAPNTEAEVASIDLFLERLAPLMANKAFGTLHQDAAYHLLVSAGKLDADVITSEQETFAFRRTVLARLLPNVLENSSVDPHIVLDRVQRHVHLTGVPQKVTQELTVIAHEAIEKMPEVEGLENVDQTPRVVQELAQSILDYTNIGRAIPADDPHVSRYFDNWSQRMDNLYLVSPADSVKIANLIAVGKIKAHPLIQKASTRIVERSLEQPSISLQTKFLPPYLRDTTNTYH